MNTWQSRGVSPQVICFAIENFDEVYTADPGIPERLEDALAAVGAVPAHVDMRTRPGTYCVTLENPALKPEDAITIFANFGFAAQLKEG